MALGFAQALLAQPEKPSFSQCGFSVFQSFKRQLL
jgi:hypothetical protein